MIVDVHTHVWERPAHLSESFIHDARVTAGNPNLEIAVDLEAHWAAMAPVDRAIVLGFRARHVGVLVPNEYVAAYVEQRVSEIRGNSTGVDPMRLLALASIYIADELFRLRNQHAETERDASVRLGALRDMLEAVVTDG